MKYTVRYNGTPIKDFTNKVDAQKYMADFAQVITLTEQKLALIDEAVLKSDMRESKELLKHIMEL